MERYVFGRIISALGLGLIATGLVPVAQMPVIRMPAALAQTAITPDAITPDDTLGTEASQVRTVDSQTQYIEGGATRGRNVFHSFLDFNIAPNQAVFFRPEASVRQVLSRITGTNPSNIFGKLGVMGEANLWLINPNGILFGPEASLDIQQSFYATTATEIGLGAASFSAIAPESSQLLAIPPNSSFLNYLTPASNDILTQGALSGGQTVTLAGQNIRTTGPLDANNRLSLIAQNAIVTEALLTVPGGEIDLLASSGAIEAGALNTTEANGGGTITLTAAGNILTNGIFAQAASGQRAVGNGGAITLSSTDGDIFNTGPVNASAFSGMGNAGDGGTISMSAGTGNIINQATLDTGSFSNRNGNASNGGSITLSSTAGNITNNGRLNSRAFANGGNAGNGGAIILTSTTGNIQNNNILRSVSITQTDGNNSRTGGDITIATTAGDIIIDRRVQSSSVAFSGSAGDGGNIQISSLSGNIYLQDKLISNVFSERSRAGDGGTITVTTTEGSIVQEQSLNSNSVSDADQAGNGGAITLTTLNGDLVIKGDVIANSNAPRENRNRGGAIMLSADAGNILGEDSNLFSFTLSETGQATGEGGDITLRAGDRIAGLSLFTLSDAGVSGNIVIEGSGDLTIQNTQLVPTGQRQIPNRFDPDTIRTTVLSPTGQPGRVNISSAGNLTLENVIILSDANQNNVDAGNVTLSSAAAIELIESQIFTNTNSTGQGGNITVQSHDSILLNRTNLVTNTSGSGLAGSIVIEDAQRFVLRNNSLLLADAGGNADGGNIDITTDFVVAILDENSNIIANAERGNGGEINITARGVYGFLAQPGLTTTELRNNAFSDISASSQLGRDGSININALDRVLEVEPEALDDTFLNSTNLIANSCITPNSNGESSLIMVGRGHLSVTPATSTSSDYSLGEVQPLTEKVRSTAAPTWQLGDPVVEPEDMARLADGRIVFGATCALE